MTEPDAAPPQLLSDAAIEVMDSATLLMVSMAAVTRLPEAGRELQTLIACRLVELLEIYVRRTLELIFDHDAEAWDKRNAKKRRVTVSEALTMTREELLSLAREEDAAEIARKFEDSHKVLSSYLRAEPFRPGELDQFIKLKNLRNAWVHNNGLIDHTLAEQNVTLQVGERIDRLENVLPSVAAFLGSVQYIDGLVMARYPDLGRPAAPFREVIQVRMQQSVQLMQPTVAEMDYVTHNLAEIQQNHPAVAELLPQTMVMKLNTVWTVVQADTAWALAGVDGRVLVGFETQAAAQAWLDEGEVSWEGASFDLESDGTWAYGTLASGLLFKWPSGEVGEWFTLPTA
ncbi:hypothetical protein [Deinococcus xianganensis]|uniref:Uncharacterized protein n=1 Tax=Deinococcus xianganensis TaxID=1507289 RepID=A0A6I4YVJ2_9DEIO|nr:hypothetical protein [Deinococcus xianganensis]MXV21665.1 hypothetical protein [Deinococcus xianganensis]